MYYFQSQGSKGLVVRVCFALESLLFTQISPVRHHSVARSVFGAIGGLYHGAKFGWFVLLTPL